MYDAVEDPYCYPGTTVLKNNPGIQDQAALDEYEAAMTAQRSDEPLPSGRFTVNHYRAIHHHLFQDVYPWAGKFRTVRIAKDGSAFCYPENIDREMKQLFRDLKKKRYLRAAERDTFVIEIATFLTTLNAIHPFREGNGRAQTTFATLLADQANHPFHLDRLDADAFLMAMVASFHGDERPLREQIRSLVEPK